MLNIQSGFSDNGSMNLSESLDLARQVALDKRTIIVTIMLLLYLALVNYVIRYRKKPPKVRRTHLAAAPAAETASGAKKNAENKDEHNTNSDESENSSGQTGKQTSSSTSKSSPASKKTLPS